MRITVRVNRVEYIQNTYDIDDVPDELYDEDDYGDLNDWVWEHIFDYAPDNVDYYDSETRDIDLEVTEPPEVEEPEKEDWE